MLFNWIKDHGYALSEDMYKEKLTGGGKEIIINWTAKKPVTDYFLYELKLNWHILTMKDAEIEIDDLNGGKRTAILGTNHPIDEQGWRFYLNSYDDNGIIITARNDPGNNIVVAGILAVMIGMPIIFFFRKRRNN